MLRNIRSYEENLQILRNTIAKMTQTEEGVNSIISQLMETEWEPLFEEQRRIHRNCVLCGAKYRVTTISEKAYFCQDCYTVDRAREGSRVHLHCIRANKFNLLATLTVAEWLTTLDHFQWKCAYCRKNRIDTLDHFIPVTLGGGTTVQNCVPACHRCNKIKSFVHPYNVKTIPQEIILKVQDYLKSR